MFKKRPLIAVLLLIITFVMTLAFPASAAEGKVYWVSNEEQFIAAANSSRDSDIIKLTSNITLSNPIKVRKSVTVDLQGHKLNGSLQRELKDNTRYNTNYNSNTKYDPVAGLIAALIIDITFVVVVFSGLINCIYLCVQNH